MRTICAHPGKDSDVHMAVSYTLGAKALASDAASLRRRGDDRAPFVKKLAQAELYRARQSMQRLSKSKRSQVRAAFQWMRRGYMVSWNKACGPLEPPRRY